MRQHSLRDVQRPEEVDIHLPLGVLDSRELYRAGYAVAGIGDEYVNLVSLLQHLCYSLTNGLRLCHIAVDMRDAVMTLAVTAEFEHLPTFVLKQHSGSQAYARTTACDK